MTENILLTQKQKYSELIRFVITGVISTAVTYGVYYLCLSFTNPTIAFLIGYVVAFIVNYILTVTFTFKVKATAKNGVGFIVSNVINFFLCELVLNLLIYLGVAKQWAPIPMYAICVPINFVIVRFVMKRL